MTLFQDMTFFDDTNDDSMMDKAADMAGDAMEAAGDVAEGAMDAMKGAAGAVMGAVTGDDDSNDASEEADADAA